MTDADARELCRSLLEVELPRRWAHSQGVARQAGEIGQALNGNAELVETAAWLHDIGYASSLAVCGFHPLDGARYLRDSAIGDRLLWTLVAHHTCAQIEAEGRGLGDQLSAEFPVEDVEPFLLAALTYCDMTTSPDGELVDARRRIEEILTRYPEGHVVHRSISRAAPSLRAQVDEVSARVEAAA